MSRAPLIVVICHLWSFEGVYDCEGWCKWVGLPNLTKVGLAGLGFAFDAGWNCWMEVGQVVNFVFRPVRLLVVPGPPRLAARFA